MWISSVASSPRMCAPSSLRSDARKRTGRQQDHAGAQRPLAAVQVAYDHGPAGAQRRVPAHELDAVTPQVALDGTRHRVDHVRHTRAQAVHHHVGRKADPDAVRLAAHPGRGAAGAGPALDDRHAVPEVGDLVGSLLAGRTAADHHQIELVGHTSAQQREERPLSGHALELLRRAPVELQVGADDRSERGPRREYLARPGEPRDA